MNVIRQARERHGYSQRELAKRAGISFRCVQQLEDPRHNWSVHSVERVGKALAIPGSALRYHFDHPFAITVDSIEDVSLRIVEDGFDSWKLHLFNFVDRFRDTRDLQLIAAGPVDELDPLLRALMASTVETLCDTVPAWCRGIEALKEPWFVAGIENLKASALSESPALFRVRNIFVLENFLSRA